MKEWRSIPAKVVYAIHERQLAEHGGLDGVRDENSVESALAGPQNLAACESPDAAAHAASYAVGIARNPGFADGKKRTAWVVARLFLTLNGYTVRFDPRDAIRTMLDVASGSIPEDELAMWLRSRIQSRLIAGSTSVLSQK
jgi:death-on-curing protein